jgi:hypothetical protein
MVTATSGAVHTKMPVESNVDRDLDGADLAWLGANPGLLGLEYFVPDFGKNDCP